MNDAKRQELEQRDLMGLAISCANRCNVRVGDVFSIDRSAPVAKARALFCACLYYRGHWSYPAIAKLVDRDHSSVMASVRKITLFELEGLDTAERYPVPAPQHMSLADAVFAMRMQ